MSSRYFAAAIVLIYLMGVTSADPPDEDDDAEETEDSGLVPETGPNTSDESAKRKDSVNSSLILMGPSIRYFAVVTRRTMDEITKAILEDLSRCFCKQFWIVRDAYGGPLNKQCDISLLEEQISFRKNLYAYGLYFGASMEWNTNAHRIRRRSSDNRHDPIKFPTKCMVSLAEVLHPITKRNDMLAFSSQAIFIGENLKNVPYKRLDPPCSIGQFCHESTISTIIMVGIGGFLICVVVFMKTKEDISFWIMTVTGKEEELPNEAVLQMGQSAARNTN
ncbi:uncharacterized protein TEOVI_000551500 [Trypanosoma equiperdum]|uniref:Uncharacterized protein n=2 Tax=Trypanozoon TaxID=39700 RepID=Q586M0_TRYB2|nr:hypothetical protein Tb927.2.2490 [Trypanosoma brucei brucei TREU927]AAQ15706.1 hypothetical protein Tb927.2.2490 [Trypanosoma brucei brucei TREU927]AAX79151.1 hypothetical protein Tb927.2.2490 [Trypanosoma brucei]SCU68382.1 hypothetical protein, conserved [Trypanosoma equiperdum]